MKVFNPLTVAVGVAFVGGVSAKATQSQTKDLTLDTNIVPTWSQLGTNANSYKIKLARVTAYWKEAEERDVSAARSLYSKSSDKNSAEDKVQAFYDGAEKCLGKQSTTDRKLQSDIDTALDQIKDCIKNVKTPVFNVASTVNFPKGYPSSVSVDYSDATKTDEDADLKEYSKSISLDTSLPTWDDLGTNADSYKIKLERLKSYWAAAETRDKKAADSFYAADKNKDSAVNKVKDFYDDAEDCMKKQAETTRKTRSEIDQGLQEIKDCIAKKATPLTFTVVKTVKLPSNYDSPLVVDYSKAIKEDEEDDLYEAPKDISLDSDIVPTWDDLGTSANTYKIKLARVSSYWKEMEERDVSAARSFYSKTADKNAAEDKVEAFYDGAEKCLNKQSTTERKTQSEINTALGQIKNCITKSVTPPVFTVVRITTLPSNYNKPVTVDYTSAIKSDEDADLTEYGKQISLDTALPTWDDLGTNADSYKIKLNRLQSYWKAAETRDKNAVEPFYAADKNEDAAIKKVTDFYDDAEACMKKETETTRKTHSEIDQGLKNIKDCIAKTATPLSFTVVKTVNLSESYYSPLVVDYSKAIKEDEEGDLYEAPKDISLDTNIVPTWSQLGTSANTYKIKLARVSSYWKEMEERDVSAARSFYSKTADKNAAEDKVEAFYDGAEKCLNKQSTTERKTQSEVDTALGQIEDCITKNVKVPVFTVVRITALPSNYWKPVSVDYSSAIKSDEDADLKEYGKQISLDTIVPSWDQLGTNPKSDKIKLNRLKTYWTAAEARDLDAVDSLYLTKSYNDAAVKKVKDYYDDAQACMEKQSETVRKTRSEIDEGLKAINDCITKIATPLTFTVLKTVNLPTNYDAPLVLDFSKAIASDEEADLKEATPAPTPAPPTKQIALDYDIVPTWSQLGTNSKTKKIRLHRIYSYWDKTEARDKKAVKNFYSTTKEDNAAAEKIDDFYDGAKACLDKQKVLERKTRTQIETALEEIRDCIIKSVVPPVFTVLTTVSLPEDYFSVVEDDDYGETNKQDVIEDDAEAAVETQTTPEITTAPLVTPVATTASPAQLAAPIIEVTPAPYSAPVDNDASSVSTQVSPLISPTTTTAPETVPVPIDDRVDEPEQPQQITEPPPATYTGDFTPPEEKDDGYFMPGVPAPEEELPSTDEGTTVAAPPSQDETDDEPPRNYDTDGNVAPDEPTGDLTPPEENDTGNFYPPQETDTSDIAPGVPAQEEPIDVSPPGTDPLDIAVDPNAYPVSLPDLPDSEALEWPFSPASPDVPPLWALDLDKSQSVDASEWQQYIEHLHTIARSTIVRGNDPVAVALLKQIVDFHYGSFAQCITSKLKADQILTLTESEYEPVAHWIEKNCYVKFRYSLLAGAPPFEWIAKEKPIVSAQEIEVWFTKRVNTARKDITRLPNVSAAQQEMVERFIGCAYASLNAAGAAPIYRDAFYAALTHIEQCASA